MGLIDRLYHSTKLINVLLIAFFLGLIAWIIVGTPEAKCHDTQCYGGMCMTSAACAPGCHCIGNRCG